MLFAIRACCQALRDDGSDKSKQYFYAYMKELSEETKQFIVSHRKEDVRALALKSSRYPQVDVAEAVVQISGWQIAEKKVPLWAATEGILYPRHLSMEQCSSEVTARYKAGLVQGKSFVDLTAGLGVDCSFIARNFENADYVERQNVLCDLAKNNFEKLALKHIRIHNADGIEYLKAMDPVDCIFLDPARRDSNGGKTVAISDCEPDVCSLEDLLVDKAKTVMIKLSPMLDIFTALRDLKYIKSVHVVAVNNECKELIILLSKGKIFIHNSDNQINITCSQAVNNFSWQHFSFDYAQERNAVCKMADHVGEYLYEPGAALLKAAPFKLLSERYGLAQLNMNSHLYTSSEMLDFPGRRFRVEGVSGFGKKELKTFLSGLVQANITIRNFPSTVAELRKKLKLKEGGEVYLFATTLNDGCKVLVKCKKA